MACKITLIGAGSVVFAKTLIGDILQFPELSNATICLMDIDPSRLKVADIMMNKIVRKLGIGAKIESTLNQREAITGAKYVICTVQVGGYKPATVHDFEIPKKYGLKQTIADTLGVGGVFRALRTIPVIQGIARDIADVGHSDCLFLNYSNPMAMNCWAVQESVGIPHVGLCHSVFGTANVLSRFAKLPPEDVSYLVAGINHMAFFLKFQYKGQDAYPLLFKALEDPERVNELVRFEMMRRTGYFVTESSEHQSEYVPYFIHHGQEMIDQFKIPIDEYLRRCEAIIGTWQETEDKLLGKDSDIVVNPQSHEYGSYIIHSRETDTLRTVYGCVPNHGVIDNLLQGCNVEVPCQVDGTGLRPVKIGKLPPQLAAICATNINVQELTVKAALTQKREHIYHAVMMDPHTSATLPLDKIWAMCDELIEAHQKDGFLGEFTPTLANTGRGFEGIGDRIIARLEGVGVFQEEKGAQNRVKLVVENPNDRAATVDFALESEDDRFVTAAEMQFSVNLPAQKSTEIEFEFVNEERIDSNYGVRLMSNSQNVLTIDANLCPRTRISADAEGTAKFQLELASFDALEGELSTEADEVCLKMKVYDSDVTVHQEIPWRGSCVELFFSDVSGSSIKQLFLRPSKEGEASIICGDHGAIPGATIAQRVTDMYYEIEAKIPFKAVGIPSGSKEFLFDCICMLTALGDAHSGGRTNLNGKFTSNTENGHYAWVKFD